MANVEIKNFAAAGGRAVPKEKRSFSKSRELASRAGKVGGASVPNEKRSFSMDHDLARRAGAVGGKAKKRAL